MPVLADGTDRYADILRDIQNRYRLPAAGYAIVSSEEIIAQGVFGYRKRGEDVPVTPDEKWHIGSITKAMTSTLAHHLVVEGIIGFETTVGEVLGENFDGIQESYRGVTLAQLLSHRSGMVSDLVTLPVWTSLRDQTIEQSAHRQALVAEILAAPPLAEAGARYIYSNGGYVVAGAMMETLTGENWDQLLKRYIFAPLGMESAGFGPPGTPGTLDNALGHALAGGGLRPVDLSPLADNPAALGPAGTVHATLHDLALFAIAHLGGAPDYLSARDLGRLHTPAPGEDYAFGWQIASHPCFEGETILTHTGSNTMWFVIVFLDKKTDRGTIVTANAGDPPARTALFDLSRKLLAELYDRDCSL